MATDNTPPRNGLILAIAAASVVTLGTLKLVFDSYYRYVMEDEVAAKAAPPTELRAARLEEQQRLSGGPVPIEKAMKDLAKGRDGLIQPQQSADDGPLVGWSKAPRAVASAITATTAADAGALTEPLLADGGTPHALAGATDGGAAIAPHAPLADAGHAQEKDTHGGHPAPNASDAGGGMKR